MKWRYKFSNPYSQSRKLGAEGRQYESEADLEEVSMSETDYGYLVKYKRCLGKKVSGFEFYSTNSGRMNNMYCHF